MDSGGGVSPRGPGQSGQALVEAALTFPLHVLVVLGILQAGLLSVGKGLTEYAAFAAARAALAEPEPGAPRARRLDPRKAAAIALLPAAPAEPGMAGRLLRGIPGAGILADPGRLAQARARTAVEVRRSKDGVSARVTHDFPLVVPVVNRLFAWGGGLFGRFPAPAGTPSLRLEAKCALPR